MSLCASAGFWLLKVLQQLLGFGIIGRKFQRAWHLGTRQVRFFLLEIDASKRRVGKRGSAGNWTTLLKRYKGRLRPAIPRLSTRRLLASISSRKNLTWRVPRCNAR